MNLLKCDYKTQKYPKRPKLENMEGKNGDFPLIQKLIGCFRGQKKMNQMEKPKKKDQGDETDGWCLSQP